MLGWLALVGCTGGKPAPIEVASGVQLLAPAPEVVGYTRINVAGPIALPDVKIEERWDGPHLGGDVITYDVTTWDITGEERVLESVRHFYGKAGYGYLGTLDEAGELQAWTPPQIVLPADPSVGQSWGGTHRKGDATSARTCEILNSDYCAGGIVVVCDSRRDGATVVIRDHFCSDAGWGGFEAMFQGGSNPTVRMWSEDLTRNGELVTIVPPPEVSP